MSKIDERVLLNEADTYGIIKAIPHSDIDDLCVHYLDKGYIKLVERTKCLNIYKLTVPDNQPLF